MNRSDSERDLAIQPAINKLCGDRFTFVTGDDIAPRPTVFHAGPGQTLRTFFRRA